MIKTITLFTFLFCFVTFTTGQNIFSEEFRPKIGLVLSGGGAKGMAHIGVLKVLEELDIKPDYITGTSMGSIMGGLYAIGYSAQELDSIIRLMDWNAMLSDKIPLSRVVPEEKHDYGRFLFQFDLTPQGPKLPNAMVVGQGISEEMNYRTWHITGTENFDNFQIPFRCVASDLISGQPYVFKSGNLVTAMRASMAIPSVFSPVKIDSMLLVDGGVLDNIPVKACRDMGADIIITVNVGFREKPTFDDFKSMGDILMGSAMIRSNYEAKSSLDDTDILIAPDLSKYSSASFFDGDAIIELGEIAAWERYDELAALSDFLSLYTKKEEVKPEFLDKIYIEEIEVDDLNYLDKTFVVGKSGLQKGNSYSKTELNAAMHKLMGTRYVDNVNYSLSKGTKGHILTLIPKEAYRSKYNFSVHYDNTYKASAIFNLVFRNRVATGSNVSLSLNISEHPIVNAEYIDYLGSKQFLGTYLKSRWEYNSIPYFSNNGNEIGSFVQNYLNTEGGLLFTFDTKRIIRGGVYYKRQINNSGRGLLDLLADNVDRIGNHWWGINLNYNKNSFDEHFFANTGNEFDVSLEYPIGFGTIYTGSDSAFVRLKDLVDIPHESYLKAVAKYEQYIPINSKFNLSFFLSVGGATEDLGSTQYFTIGGLSSTARSGDIPFAGMIPKEISAQQFAMAQVNLRYELFNNFYAHFSGGAVDYRSEFEYLSFVPVRGLVSEDIVLGGNIVFSFNSLIGPLEFGYGRSTLHHESRWFFTAGFPF